MRKQVQFNGLWQSTATGVIRYADTEHGVLWERTLEASREVWRQLDVSKSHLRGYLQAQSEAGWQMVSSNRDAAREPEAYEAWHGDMFPHGATWCMRRCWRVRVTRLTAGSWIRGELCTR